MVCLQDYGFKNYKQNHHKKVLLAIHMNGPITQHFRCMNLSFTFCSPPACLQSHGPYTLPSALECLPPSSSPYLCAGWTQPASVQQPPCSKVAWKHFCDDVGLVQGITHLDCASSLLICPIQTAATELRIRMMKPSRGQIVVCFNECA